MNALREDLAKFFGVGQVPMKEGLVEQDGFDEFEKEDAVSFFAQKSWNEVYELLQGLKDDFWGGGNYRFEEWAVLRPDSIKYYLFAYVEFLLDTLEEEDPDEEFVDYFFFELYQVIRIHGASLFSLEEKDVLRNLSAFTKKAIKENSGFDMWRDGINNSIREFGTLLDSKN